MQVRPLRARGEIGGQLRLDARRRPNVDSIVDRVRELLERGRESLEGSGECLVARRRAAFVRGLQLCLDGDECAEQLLGTLGEHEQLLATRAPSLPRPAYVHEHDACVLERAANDRVQRAGTIARRAGALVTERPRHARKRERELRQDAVALRDRATCGAKRVQGPQEKRQNHRPRRTASEHLGAKERRVPHRGGRTDCHRIDHRDEQPDG